MAPRKPPKPQRPPGPRTPPEGPTPAISVTASASSPYSNDSKDTLARVLSILAVAFALIFPALSYWDEHLPVIYLECKQVDVKMLPFHVETPFMPTTDEEKAEAPQVKDFERRNPGAMAVLCSVKNDGKLVVQGIRIGLNTRFVRQM